MLDLSRADIVAIVAVHLLASKARPSQQMIDTAVADAVKVVDAARAATKPAE